MRMYRQMKVIIILLLLFAFSLVLFKVFIVYNKQGEDLLINNGLLDLSQEQLVEDISYHLRGKWEKDNKGFRLKLSNEIPVELALVIPGLFVDYNIVINGKEYKKGEEVIIDEGLYRRNGELFLLDVVLETGLVKEDIIKQSLNRVLLGKTQAIRDYYKKVIIIGIFAAGAFFSLTLFSFALDAGGKRQEYLLYLGLIALVSFVKSFIELGENVGSLLYSFTVFSKQLNNITTLLNSYLLFILYSKLYPGYLKKIFDRVSLWMAIILSGLVLTIGYVANFQLIQDLTRIYLLWVVSLSIYINLKAYLRNERGALILFSGHLLYITTATFALRVYRNHLPPGELSKYLNLAQYGCLIFVLLFAIVIAMRYSRQAEQASVLGKELKVVNQELEKRVKDQTRELMSTNKKLKEAYLKVKGYLTYDTMTRVYTRNVGMVKLEEWFESLVRTNSKLAVCYIDIDNLKEVNDKFGHETGDRLIKETASILRNNVRQNDFIIRLGGDEFLICFPKSSASKAEKIWQRIIKCISERNIQKGSQYKISISHGIVELDNIQHDSVDKIIKQADKKMYQEKRRTKKI